MRITVAAGIPARAHALVLFVPAGAEVPEGYPAPLRAALADRLRHASIAVLPTLGHIAAPWLAVVRTPNWQDMVEVRRRGGAVARALIAERIGSAALVVPEGTEPQRCVGFLVGMSQGTYQWDRYLAQPLPRLQDVTVVAPRTSAWRTATAEAADLGGWIARCRDLVNLPAADLGPEEFEGECRQIARSAKLRLRVLNRRVHFLDRRADRL